MQQQKHHYSIVNEDHGGIVWQGFVTEWNAEDHMYALAMADRGTCYKLYCEGELIDAVEACTDEQNRADSKQATHFNWLAYQRELSRRCDALTVGE